MMRFFVNILKYAEQPLDLTKLLEKLLKKYLYMIL